jgi:hypothetical protein
MIWRLQHQNALAHAASTCRSTMTGSVNANVESWPGRDSTEGLMVPQKQPKRGRLWLTGDSCIRLRPEHPNHVWSYDFIEDGTYEGRNSSQRPSSFGGLAILLAILRASSKA